MLDIIYVLLTPKFVSLARTFPLNIRPIYPTAYLTFPLGFLSKTGFPKHLKKKTCPSILFSISDKSNSFLPVAKTQNPGIIFNFSLLSRIITKPQEMLWFDLQNISGISTSYPLYTPVQSNTSPLLEFCNRVLAGPLAFCTFNLFSIQQPDCSC